MFRFVIFHGLYDVVKADLEVDNYLCWYHRYDLVLVQEIGHVSGLFYARILSIHHCIFTQDLGWDKVIKNLVVKCPYTLVYSYLK